MKRRAMCILVLLGFSMIGITTLDLIQPPITSIENRLSGVAQAKSEASSIILHFTL